jgi:hypothetical protein
MLVAVAVVVGFANPPLTTHHSALGNIINHQSSCMTSSSISSLHPSRPSCRADPEVMRTVKCLYFAFFEKLQEASYKSIWYSFCLLMNTLPMISILHARWHGSIFCGSSKVQPRPVAGRTTQSINGSTASGWLLT